MSCSDLMSKIFCFGYGYCCDYLGHVLGAQGSWEICGTTRDPEKQEILQNRNVKTFLFDDGSPLSDPLYALKDVTHILISTPPDDVGDPAFLSHAEDILALKSLEWVGYLSTTGVYGDRGGAWVDEQAEISPTSKRGSRRAKAEAQWLDLYQRHGLPVHIFRLSGIYGPARSALDSVRAGVARRIEKPGHAFNRVHVEDIVQTLMASMRNPNPGSAYNLADDCPSSSAAVISYACELLDIEPPPVIPYEEADMAPIARSFYKDNKRISNQKIKDELGVELNHPDYMEGLESCLEVEQYAIAMQEEMMPEQA